MTTLLRTLVVVGDTTLTKELPPDFSIGGTFEFLRLQGGHQFVIDPHRDSQQLIRPLDLDDAESDEAKAVEGFPENIQRIDVTSPAGITLQLFSLNDQNPELTMGPEYVTGQVLTIKPYALELDGKVVANLIDAAYVDQNNRTFSDYCVISPFSTGVNDAKPTEIVVGHTREARLESALRHAIAAINAIPNTGIPSVAKTTYKLLPQLEAALA